jgi:outer membrane immunogenic protein
MRNSKMIVSAAVAISAIVGVGAASAADMAARTYSKAPAMVAAAPSWTGCYIGGGGGYGLWNQENTSYVDIVPRLQTANTVTNGGRGYFGTVQAGCDYQFAALGNQFVLGAFGDYDFASLKGDVSLPAVIGAPVGQEKMNSAWSVGGRAGWLVTPSLLTYFSAGYTQATFNQTNFTSFGFAVPNFFINKQTYNGYFIGAGDEYALNFLPGLFWKTEYRFSTYDTKTNPILFFPDGAPALDSIDSKKYVQTIRSELTYHFNWSGPVVAKY